MGQQALSIGNTLAGKGQAKALERSESVSATWPAVSCGSDRVCVPTNG